MEQERNILEEALKYFDLGIDFTEEELKEAYRNKVKVIPVDFRLGVVEHNKFNKNYEYYVALYKWAKIKYIESNILKDVNINNILKDNTIRIKNLPKTYIDFYNKNSIYHSILNSLLVNIKTNFDLFCNIDMENANTIEEVDVCFNKFILDSKKDFERFALDTINAVQEQVVYKLNDITKLDYEKIDSIKQLIEAVYQIVRKIDEYQTAKKIEEYQKTKEILEKKEKIKNFTSRIKEKYKIELQLEGEEVNKQKVEREALRYYAEMVNEKDYNKFLELYNKAMSYIDSYMPEALEEQEEKKHRI